jgi:beta-glucosidase
MGGACGASPFSIRAQVTRAAIQLAATDAFLWQSSLGEIWRGYRRCCDRSVKVSAPKRSAEETVRVTVKVKNTGKRAGDEVEQLYVRHMGSKVERPQLELKGCRRVRIAAGAEQNVAFDLKPRDFAYRDASAHVWRLQKEQVRVLASGSSDKLPVQSTVEVERNVSLT